MPLRGVSRHQDILGAGNALTPAQHLADMELIREIGANTVRLAHYQHSQEFYDACDEAGMVVWAEIPFISVMNEDPAAHENCILQMKELIIQNYNHPSICFWGSPTRSRSAENVPGWRKPPRPERSDPRAGSHKAHHHRTDVPGAQRKPFK